MAAQMPNFISCHPWKSTTFAGIKAKFKSNISEEALDDVEIPGWFIGDVWTSHGVAEILLVDNESNQLSEQEAIEFLSETLAKLDAAHD